MMGIIELLILCFGAFGAIYGSKCIPETALCSPYWVKMEPHKNLMESVEELNSWCRKQSLFFRCLEDVLLGKYGNYSELPTNMLVSKMFSADLCLEGSTSRKRYLDNAACINQLDTEYYTLPDYLEIVTPDSSVPPNKCSLAEKSFSCIAATMVIKCGFDAGKVYRYLLKVTKYNEEVCGVESSERSTCDEAPGSGDKLTNIYYDLVHKFGSVPEQLTDSSSTIETETVFQSEETISEALNKAFDAIDYSEDLLKFESFTSGNKTNRSTDGSRKWPVIIEQFKGLLFYNYSNKEFEFYWRQPGSFPIERVTCEHVLTPHMRGVLLECIVHHRSKEPECYYSTMPTTNERITPELIRDIDLTIPDDSSLDISESLDLTGYLRDYHRFRMSWEYFISSRLVMHADELRELNKYLEVKYPNHKVCAKELRYYDIINDRYISWWQCPSLFSDELRNEILTFLFGRRIKDDVLFLSVFNVDDKSYVHLFEPLLHAFDKVVCERVNECHPRGRGVFKCSLKRRDLKGCNSCCDRPSSGCRTESEREEVETKSSFEIFSSTEGGSGAFEDVSVFSDGNVHQDHVVEVTERTEEMDNSVTGVIGEDGDLVALDLSELQSYSKSDSSDANLLFLSENSEASSENKFLARTGILSTSDNDIVYDNLSEDVLELLQDNILVLQAVPSFADFQAAYDMDSEEVL